MINTVYEIKIKVTGPAYRLFANDSRVRYDIGGFMTREYITDDDKFELANCAISDECNFDTGEKYMLIQSVEPYTSHFVAHEIESKICSFINDQLRQFSVELNDVLGR